MLHESQFVKHFLEMYKKIGTLIAAVLLVNIGLAKVGDNEGNGHNITITVKGKNYVAKRFMSLTYFIVVKSIERLSAGLISVKPCKYIFSSLEDKLAG